MTVSVLELARLGVANGPSAERVSYPEIGAQNLAAMEVDHFWFTERRALVLSLLQRHLAPGAVGVDVGCGTGYSAAWLTEQGFPTVGVDALPGFKKLQSSGKGFGFLQADLMQMKLQPEFEFLTLLDTIEHVERDADFLRQVISMVKPGGLVLITVPAFRSLWSPVDDFSGHFRRYRKKDFPVLINNLPLKIELSMYFYGTLLPLYLFSRWLAKRNKGSAPKAEYQPSPLVNRTCRAMLRIERLLYPYGLPVGSSLFVLLRKTSPV